jgi:putative PIN family toxin of toxin-antitoxin system
VLDTNVLLAGLGTRGLCEALVAACLRDHTVIMSQHIIDEFSRHYQNKFKISAEQTAWVIQMLTAHAERVTPAELPADAFSDPDDLPVLGTAIAGQADCLVTGDREMLKLGVFRSVAILSPRAFYERLRAG